MVIDNACSPLGARILCDVLMFRLLCIVVVPLFDGVPDHVGHDTGEGITP